MNESFKKAGVVLQSGNQELKSIINKVNHIERLNQKINVFLPTEFAEYCKVANFSSNKLIIITANSSIATQLRFMAPDIIQKFKKEPLLESIKEIQFKIAMPQVKRYQPRKKTKVQMLSKETANVIRDFAQSLNDEKLRKIMERIAEHTDEDVKKP